MELKRLSHEHISQILQLQDLVVAQLPDLEVYVCTTEDELNTVMDQDIALGAYDAERLMAVAICICNRDCPGNLGQKWEEDPQTSFTFDAVFVHPDCRGQSLQRKLIEAAKEIAKREGAATMWCTVSPNNPFSYRNFTKAGFVTVEKNVSMYGGHIRDVLKMIL